MRRTSQHTCTEPGQLFPHCMLGPRRRAAWLPWAAAGCQSVSWGGGGAPVLLTPHAGEGTNHTLPKQTLHSPSNSYSPGPGGGKNEGPWQIGGSDLTNLRNFIAQNLPSLGKGGSFGNQSLGQSQRHWVEGEFGAFGPLSCAGRMGEVGCRLL